MSFRLSDYVAVHPIHEITGVLKLMDALVSNTDAYQLYVNAALGVRPSEERRELLLQGYFGKLDLVTMIQKCHGESSTQVHAVALILKKLIEWDLVSDSDLGLPHQPCPFLWNKKLIKSLLDINVVDNILRGVGYITQKYRRSVPAIIISKGGGEYTGTGFLVRHNSNVILVTAKHNVDPSENISFKEFITEPGVTITCKQDEWLLDPLADLALMPVEVGGDVPLLTLTEFCPILTETISLGYPKISTADQPYLLAHRGELNAVVTSYLNKQQYLAISNAVSPGNSGGPVLNHAGLVIGVVTDAFEGSYGDGASIVRGATPSSSVLHFLRSHFKA